MPEAANLDVSIYLHVLLNDKEILAPKFFVYFHSLQAQASAKFRPQRLTMADMAMELSDEQIDRLLSEAETRLTGQRSSTTITSNPNKALLPAGSGTVNSTTELPKEQEQAKLSKDLSVRVPELKNKLKAKVSSHFDTVLCRFRCLDLMMKLLSQT